MQASEHAKDTWMMKMETGSATKSNIRSFGVRQHSQSFPRLMDMFHSDLIKKMFLVLPPLATAVGLYSHQIISYIIIVFCLTFNFFKQNHVLTVEEEQFLNTFNTFHDLTMNVF